MFFDASHLFQVRSYCEWVLSDSVLAVRCRRREVFLCLMEIKLTLTPRRAKTHRDNETPTSTTNVYS